MQSTVLTGKIVFLFPKMYLVPSVHCQQCGHITVQTHTLVSNYSLCQLQLACVGRCWLKNDDITKFTSFHSL